MKVQNLLQSFLVVSLVLSSVAQADGNRPPRYPGPSEGGGRPGGGRGGGNPSPGPIRPDPSDDCRHDRRRPGCDDDRRDDRHHDHRGDHRDDHRGGGYHPRPHPRPEPRPYPRPEPRPYDPPYTPPYNPPSSSYYESSIVLPSVTRRTGGEWLRIKVNRPIRIDYISVRVYDASVYLHETYVITRNGTRYQLRELTRTGTFSTQRVSEIFNIYEDIIAIDIRAESMGGHADLSVTAVSSDDATSLSFKRY